MATADLRLSFGALFIGCAISLPFSGMAALQAFLYFRKYWHKDPPRIKWMVAGLSSLDLLHTIFICQGVWHYLVLNWGNLSELDHLTWTVATSIAITAIMTFFVHMFFANRVWRLSKGGRIITGLIVILAIVRLGSGFTTTGQMLRLKSFSQFIRDFRWLFTFGLAMTSLIDLIITASLCFYLHSSRTGYSTVDDVINRIIVYTINNGLMTTVVSVTAMICAAAMPNNFLFLSLHFIIAKCYMNSVLATLNSRDAIRDRDDSVPMPVIISVDQRTQEPRFRRPKHYSVRKGANQSLGSTASNGQTNLDNVKVSPDSETKSPIRDSYASSGKTRFDYPYYGRTPGRKFKGTKHDALSTFGGDTVDFGVNTNVGETVSFGLGPGYAGVELDPTVTLGSMWTDTGTTLGSGTGTGYGIASVAERRSEEGLEEDLTRRTVLDQPVPEDEPLDPGMRTQPSRGSSRPDTPTTPAPEYPPAVSVRRGVEASEDSHPLAPPGYTSFPAV